MNWITQSWLDFYNFVKREIIIAKVYIIGIQRDQHQSPLSLSHGPHFPPSLNILPRIPSLSFSSDILVWSLYKDTFTSMERNVPTLTIVQDPNICLTLNIPEHGKGSTTIW